MDIKEHLQLLLAAGSTLDTLWNIFIGVHLALITAIYFLNRAFTMQERFAIGIAYSLFALLNFGALTDTYMLYYALLTDIRALDADAFAKFKTTAAFFKSFDFKIDRTYLIMSIHGFAWVLVVTFIGWNNRVIRPNPARVREAD